MSARTFRTRKAAAAAAVVAFGAALLAEPAAAHVGGLAGNRGSTSVPGWMVVATGGVVVGASFLFTSLVTDHEGIRAVNAVSLSSSVPDAVRAAVRWAGRGAGLLALAAVLVTGAVGPPAPLSNLAILGVWAGWWAGYTMSVYLVGNTWPALDPWRTLAGLLPRTGERSYPDALGAWPAVAGLVLLVWVEVVSPLAAEPRLLAALVAGYTVLVLAGASVYGPGTWFGRVDPVSRVFRCYGRVAPFQRTDDGVALRLPTAALADPGEDGSGVDPAFVVALLWVTTFDGLVTTPAWASAVRPVVAAGVPGPLVYAAAMLAGLAAFLGAYRLAARRARRTADTYVAAAYLERWLAPSLLPIAAGYHLAHSLGYFLRFVPALSTALASPFAAAETVRVVVLPDWFGALQIGFVVLGHLLAVWVAHSRSFELFPGALKPVRSQYPFAVVMVAYTIVSTWIVSQPFAAPPGV